MPRLSRWMIRTAFLYLISGITIGGLLLTHKGTPFLPGIWNWLPLHIEFLLLGWVVQLVLGMAFWILPRYWTKPRRPRTFLAWGAFGLLNGGIWLVTAVTLFHIPHIWLFWGRILEISAIIFFAAHAWLRIVSREGAL